MNMNEPTYKDITTYSEIASFLREYLRREIAEVDTCTSVDEELDMLHQMEDDLLRLADKIKVIAQDVLVGAITKEAST